MKKLLTTALILAALALTACGPKDGDGLTTGDGAVSGDIPTGTVPVVSGDALPSETLPTGVTTELTEQTDSTEPTAEETAAATTPEPAETTAKATTASEKTTKATTTTPAPAKTTASETTPVPVTMPPEGQGEKEDAGDEVIDNIDEWLASIGIVEGGDFSAGD